MSTKGNFADQTMSNYSYNYDSNIPSDNAYSNVQQQNLPETHFSQVNSTYSTDLQVDIRNQARPISNTTVMESQEVWTIPLQEDTTLPSAPPPPYSAAVAPDEFLSVAPPYYASPMQVNNMVGSNYDTQAQPPPTPTIPPPKPFHIEKEYLQTIFGVFKIIEIISCLIAFSTTASYRLSVSHTYQGRCQFFIFVLVVCWVFSGFVFLLNLIGYLQAHNTKENQIKMVIAHGILSFVLIIAASLLENIPLCDYDWYRGELCRTYKVSVVFGFTAMVLFILDTAAHYIRYKTENVVYSV
eukprot:gene19036-20949_t